MGLGPCGLCLLVFGARGGRGQRREAARGWVVCGCGHVRRRALS